MDAPPAEYEALILSFWKSMPGALKQRIYRLESGDAASVRMDPAPLHALYRSRANVHARARSSARSGRVTQTAWRVFFRETPVPIEVALQGRHPKSSYDWYAPFFAETYLHDLFLVTNLALPNSASFNNVKVTKKGEHSRSPSQLYLSNFYFAQAVVEPDQWPNLVTLDAASVASWFEKVRSGCSQIPENPLEKALFALLHLCKNHHGPEDAVWTFCAFESLFQTRAAENFATLVDRISMVLNANEKQRDSLQHKLRDLYDYRSSFVQGELETVHPMHCDSMDQRIGDGYLKRLDLVTWGVRVLIACLQQYAAAGWTDAAYRSQSNIAGHPWRMQSDAAQS